jgi:glycosyltransferase involved in cell wall biosynthesis
MKILIVCSATSGKIAPFIIEQVDSLKKLGVQIDIFAIKSKGVFGYLRHYKLLKNKIKAFKPDIIHSHYGLSGLLANLQRSVPVITTFHGSDINDSKNRKLSNLANQFSAASIFVEETMMQKVKKRPNNYLIPCGVDTSIFYPFSKQEALNTLGFSANTKNILFSSAFNNQVKNYPLAKEACNLIQKTSRIKINLIELKGYNRQQVNILMNACDCVLLTSFYEGSPQFIKEAMACNCPIISTDVGDVRQITRYIEGCYTTKPDPQDVAEKIALTLKFAEEKKKTNARNYIFELELDSKMIANKVLEVYNKVLDKK